MNSILLQTFTDFEILIVDGLSPDGTLEIIKSNSKTDQRISFVSEKDDGIYDAMNKGIKLCGGEWIYFLGSDDRLYDTSVLQTISAKLINLHCDILYGNISGRKGIYDGAFNLEKLFQKNISHQAMFFNRNVFASIGEFNTRYNTHADWEFNIRCFENDKLTKKYLDVIVAEYAPGGASSVHEILFFREVLAPGKLRLFNSSSNGNYDFHKITNYDEWWRFLRNAKIRNEAELTDYSQGEQIPTVIRNMIKLQQKIPYGLLRMGAISKCCMVISYFSNKIAASF